MRGPQRGILTMASPFGRAPPSFISSAAAKPSKPSASSSSSSSSSSSKSSSSPGQLDPRVMDQLLEMQTFAGFWNLSASFAGLLKIELAVLQKQKPEKVSVASFSSATSYSHFVLIRIVLVLRGMLGDCIGCCFPSASVRFRCR